MKVTVFILITLAVASLADPTLTVSFDKDRAHADPNARIVTGQIKQAIENIARQIREAGLDPFNRNVAVDFELPVPVILSANAIVDKFLFTGLSNIVVERINFSLFQSRLTFSIVLPKLAVSIDKSEAKVIFFRNEFTGSASGSVTINAARIVGNVRVNVSIINGVSIRSLSLQFSLGSIESNLNINLLNKDLSSKVNTLLATTVPTTLNKFSSEINQLIETLALDMIQNLLNRPRMFQL